MLKDKLSHCRAANITVAYKKYFNHKQIIPLNKNDETLKGYRIKNAKTSFLVLE
jgi:hypothetical protein